MDDALSTTQLRIPPFRNLGWKNAALWSQDLAEYPNLESWSATTQADLEDCDYVLNSIVFFIVG